MDCCETTTSVAITTTRPPGLTSVSGYKVRTCLFAPVIPIRPSASVLMFMGFMGSNWMAEGAAEVPDCSR
ncbi:hypothetical protein D3C71_799050 [compost metagenome]